MKLDLHTHSTISDGHLSPVALVHAAVAGGLDIIALTVHDSAAGVAAAQAAAGGMPLQVVTGIELSTRHETEELHILGYFFDPQAPGILRHQERAVEQRHHRMHGMVAKLQNLGVRIEFDDVVRAAGPEVASLGRPHLARALLDGGHTRYYGEAFARYLSDSGPAFVHTDFPPVRAAIELIHEAGGIAVWAHPPLTVFEREIRLLAEWGLDGVECFRPALPPAESLLLETVTRELGLFPTGGSDWHGPHRALLGDYFVRSRYVREFLEVGWRRGRLLDFPAPVDARGK